jgi:hypothetical protein
MKSTTLKTGHKKKVIKVRDLNDPGTWTKAEREAYILRGWKPSV